MENLAAWNGDGIRAALLDVGGAQVENCKGCAMF